MHLQRLANKEVFVFRLKVLSGKYKYCLPLMGVKNQKRKGDVKLHDFHPQSLCELK